MRNIGAVLVIWLCYYATCFSQGSVLGQSSFPQFVDGGGTSSEMVLTNSRPSLNVCRVVFYSDQGAQIPGLGGTFALPSYGSVTYITPGVGAAISGWTQVICDTDFVGILKMRLPGVGSASVGATQPLPYGTGIGYMMPVKYERTGVNTGVAMVIDDQGSIPLVSTHTVTLTLRDQNGVTVGTAAMSFPVQKTSTHIAKFITELIPNGPWTLPTFSGTLAIQSDFWSTLINAFAVGPSEFVVYPVGGLFTCAPEYQQNVCPNK